MSNLFQFKQFSIEQENAPFKVGTDAVLLGAWACKNNPQYILDIGTGTGVIALMMAQKFKEAQIDAVELDQTAYENAKVNFENSSWGKRIHPHQTPLQSFTTKTKYDLIVCNPPFFKASYKSGNESKDRARHDGSLKVVDILRFASRHLQKKGSLSLILPFEQFEKTLENAKNFGLHLSWSCRVFPTPTSSPKRVLLEFRTYEREVRKDLLIIEDGGRHQYSKIYKELTKEFYLE